MSTQNTPNKGTELPPKRLVFLNSHPIQYFAPLYQSLNQQPGLHCSALYCSAHGLKGERDQQFGVDVKWDLPILEGYQYTFLRNYSPRPSIYSFFGLLNLGVIPQLYYTPRSVVIVHGWNYATHCLSLIAAKLFGHTVCLRAETPVNQELLRSSKVRNLRKLFFKLFLNPLVDYFLPIGQQNEQFYYLYGVPARKLIHLPYAVDNDRFRSEAQLYASDRKQLCIELEIDPQKRIFLFVGKYIHKKRPLDFLKAFASMEHRNAAAIVLVGEGELRPEIEAFIEKENLKQVVLTGFINQGQIGRYYAAADVLVMCSESGETWGLVANEASNFALPLLLSDQVGCADDLIQKGENGFVYPCGDVPLLSHYMDQLTTLSTENLNAMGQRSLDRINQYSFAVLAAQLQKIHC